MPRLKPPVAVRPGALVRARSGAALGPRAEDALFASAQVLAEGRESDGAFFGSTLVSIDLRSLAPALGHAASEAACERIYRAMEGSVRVRLRAMRIALADVSRRYPDAPLGTASVETRFRRVGPRVEVDVDVEVPLSLSSPLFSSRSRLGAEGRS